MRVKLDYYRLLWKQSVNQPEVAGPADDPWYQRIGRFVRAIACEATQPFAVPVGMTAEVAGLNPDFVGAYIGELVRFGVIRVVHRGGPGRYTRYVYCVPRSAWGHPRCAAKAS